jgi:hypothetical protein
MPNTAFNNPQLLATGHLFVTGPVRPATSPGQHLVEEITIRFLIHQHLQGQPEVIVDGVSRYSPPVAGNWDYTFDPGHGIQLGQVQGVGVAIFRWDDDNDAENPALESYNWCVTRTVVNA